MPARTRAYATPKKARTQKEDQVPADSHHHQPEPVEAASASLRQVNSAAQRLAPADVLALQRTLGNQATRRLLAGNNRLPAAATSIQRQVMSVSEFKKQTSAFGKKRVEVAKIDNALEAFHKKGSLFGQPLAYLTSLLESIDHWLKVKEGDPKNSRRKGILELKMQVVAEQERTIQKTEVVKGKTQEDVGQATNLEKPDQDAKYTDFDGKQYRITGRKPDRFIEEVRRTVDEQTGKVTYYATGQVVDFKGAMPVIARYPVPNSLGDWFPQVTHLNGMNVKPQTGIESALAMQESINQTLDANMNDGGLALSQEAVDVLYTYSAQQAQGGVSALAFDIANCIKGKMGIEDRVTRSQEDIMLDAVKARQRVTVSAHSRGTIKTDNAVRTVFKMLVESYKPGKQNDAATVELAKQGVAALVSTGIFDYQTAFQIALSQAAEFQATQQAKTDMDTYIQLVYAGNAVSYPSSALKVEMYVGSSDFVSMFVGTYTKAGAKWASGNDSSHLNKQSGGHGFTENYSKAVGQSVASDIEQRRKRGRKK